MEYKLFDKNGKATGKKVKLDDSVFGAPVNEYLLELSVYVYLSNQRKSTAHTKTRAEVRGGGAKPWKQKGTGRARHGSIRSPIWKGGGVTFGPRKERNYKKKMTKKMKKVAIRSAFSLYAKDKKLAIIDTLEIKDKKLTKQVVDLTSKLTDAKKVLYIKNQNNKDFFLGSRNLKDVNVINVNQVNVYTLLNHNFIVVLNDSLEVISKYWGKGGKQKEDKPKKISKKTKKEETKLDNLGLPTRVMSALEKSKITTVQQLKEKVEKGEKIAGVGEKSLQDIKKVLK